MIFKMIEDELRRHIRAIVLDRPFKDNYNKLYYKERFLNYKFNDKRNWYCIR